MCWGWDLMSLLQISPIKNQISPNLRFIENIPTLAIFHISNAYHKVFQGFKSTDLLEVSALLKRQFYCRYQEISVFSWLAAKPQYIA